MPGSDMTRTALRAPSTASPRLRAWCTHAKNPPESGSFSSAAPGGGQGVRGLGTPSGRVAGEVRGLVPPWAGAEARDGEALKGATTRLRGVTRGGRQASASSVRIQDGGSSTWPASRAEAVTSLQAQVQWSAASLVVGQPQMVQV